MGSRDHNHRDYTKLGQDFRIAIACMDAAQRFKSVKAVNPEQSTPVRTDSPPEYHAQALATQLRAISADIDTHRAQLLELLVCFDEQAGWAEAGARNCAEWANAQLGIARVSAYEFLRVGRELRELPVIRALFRGGELSWSKVRLLVKVADEDNERQLADVAIDATVADVDRICREFRWKKLEQGDTEPDQTGEYRTAEDIAAWQQLQNRSLTWREQPDGSTEIRITLPPEKAQAILRSLEHCENELYEGKKVADENKVTERSTPRQRKADAMVLMAERSLQAADSTVSSADRYQVVLHMDTKDLVSQPEEITQNCIHVHNQHTSPATGILPFPPKRPWIEGAGAIARSVAQRITCDCSVVGMLFEQGEPLNIGRKTRVWPTAIDRAIRARDRHCQFTGCSEHRHLDLHHIVHWSDGGETSVENGLCLCHQHHALVHEGGYRIERVNRGDIQSSSIELLPSRNRFRFIRPQFIKSGTLDKYTSSHSQCREQPAAYCITSSNPAGTSTQGLKIFLRPALACAA